MSVLKAVPAILKTDGRRLLRDRFLVSAAFYVMGTALVMRWLIPWMQGEILAKAAFDITPYIPMGVSYIILINTSVLTGIVGGFLLLESREERVIDAIRISPTPLSVHLLTYAVVLTIVGIAVATAESLLLGVGIPPWPAMLVSAALCAPSGMISALIISSVASNKVEAFAVIKLTTFMGFIAPGAFFLPEPYLYLAGVVPQYWACKIWWVAASGSGDWAWFILPGLLSTAMWLVAMVFYFRKKVGA